MFDRNDQDIKISQLMQDRTASQLGDGQDDSVVYEVEAEREYVNRLKSQREKIESLYSRYDVLLKDLKCKDFQIKEKEKTICTLQMKCKGLSQAHQESTLFKQENDDIKAENINLQKAMVELEESYSYLHGQYKSKEYASSQKYDEVQFLNDQLMNKLKALTKRYQDREEEFQTKYRNLAQNFQNFKSQAKKSKEQQTEDNQLLRSSLMQREEEAKLLKTENQCLKSRIVELEQGVNQLIFEHEEKVEQIQKQRKCQTRILKNQIQHLKELNYSLDKKWQKLRQECEIKEISLKELNVVIQEHDKQNCEALQLVKHQFTQEKSRLKEQLIQQESHIDRLQRKIADLVRKEQCLYGKIKKYEVCLDAKKNLRQIEQQELDRINLLLSQQ